MKTAALLICLALVGCTSSTQYGQCIGAFDDAKPDLSYRVSAWNVVLAIVFSETIIVPAYVVLEEARCPTGTVDAPAK